MEHKPMSEDEESMIPRVKATSHGSYRSQILGHPRTVLQSFNDPHFWADANRSLSKAIKDVVRNLRKMWNQANQY